MNDTVAPNNVINIFAKKLSDNLSEKLSAKDALANQSPEEAVVHFHSVLDRVLTDFSTMSVMEKWEVFESMVEMNKRMFELYFDVKKRLDYKETFE